jgi:hypothetical protein
MKYELVNDLLISLVSLVTNAVSNKLLFFCTKYFWIESVDETRKKSCRRKGKNNLVDEKGK